MAPIGFDLCLSYSSMGDYLKIVEVAPSVLDLIEKTQKGYKAFGEGANVYSPLLALYGHSMDMLGNFEEGEALCEKAVRFAHEINDFYSMGFAEFEYGILFNVKGDGKNAIEHLQKAIRYG